MSISGAIADMKVRMRGFRIPHPRLEDAQAQMHILRKTGMNSKRKPQKILPILGPSFSGKSTIITDLREQVAMDEGVEPGRHPILHVTLSSKATIAGLGADIMEALEEDGLPDVVLAGLLGPRKAKTRREGRIAGDFTQTQAMRVASRLLELAGVELLVIDEIHHFVHSDGAKTTAWSVSEALKRFVIVGVCPLVVIGVGEARRIISRKNNDQFVSRCEEPIILSPLNLEVPYEAQTFCDYVKAIDHNLQRAGIFPGPSGLAAAFNLACLYDVSAGVIGTVSNLIEVAAGLAIQREQPGIGTIDLSTAVERWAMPLGYVDHNPWADGPRSVEQMRAVRASLWAPDAW